MKSILCAACCFLLASPCWAIVRRDNVTDTQYTNLGSTYSDVTWIKGNDGNYGSGILIAPDWILTAGHVDTSGALTSIRTGLGPDVFGSTLSRVVAVATPYDDSPLSGTDIKLLQLAEPVTSVPTLRRRYSGTVASLVGDTATVVGYGRSGTGISGDTEQLGSKRAMTNVIDGQGGIFASFYGGATSQWSSNLIATDFDNSGAPNLWGSTTPTSLEGGLAPGDSGGPWIVGGEIAAVSNFAGSTSTPTFYGYNVPSGATAVQPWRAWINSAMGGVNWITKGTSGFRTTANWGDGVVPTNADVRFSVPTSPGSTPTITHNANNVVENMTVEFGRHVFEMNGFSMTATGASKIDSDGQLVIREGPLVVNANLDISNHSYLEVAADASLDINRTETSEAFYVGNYGNDNIFQLQGGRVDVTGRTYVGIQPNSSGTMNLSYGQVVMLGNLHLGRDGTGTLVQSQTGGSAATLKVTGNLTLGINESGVGVFRKTSSGLTNIVSSTAGGGPGHLIIGVSGQGTFEQSAGITWVANDISLADQSSSSRGTLNLTGGILHADDDLVVGYRGNGVMTTNDSMNPTSVTTGNRLILGLIDDQDSSDLDGQYTQSGGAALQVGTDIQIGASGSGVLRVEGGTVTTGTIAGGAMYLGVNALGVGTLEAVSGTTTVAQTIVVGNLGIGALNIRGSAVVAGQSLSLGRGAAAQGSVNHEDGSVQLAANLLLGDFDTGDYGSATPPVFSYNKSGGTLTVGQAFRIGFDQYNHGSFTQSDGTTTVGRVGEATDVVVGQNVGSVGTLDLSGGDFISRSSMTVGLSGTGTAIQSGTSRVRIDGDLVLANLADSAGSYTLQGGDLDVSQGRITGGWGVSQFVFSGGTLHAAEIETGPFGGLLEAGGTLSPGAGPLGDSPIGTTTIHGNLRQAPTASLAIDVSDASSDFLLVDGAVELDGDLAITLRGTLPSPTSYYTIVSAPSIGVYYSFANVSFGSRLATTDGTGSFIVDLVSTGSNAIPTDVVLRDFLAAPPVLDGDFDLDGDVDGADVLAWQQGLSPDPQSQSDLESWRHNFGASVATPTQAAVPEPATAAMLLIAAVVMRSRLRLIRADARSEHTPS